LIEREALALMDEPIVVPYSGRPSISRLVNQPADDLAVVDLKRHLVRAYFEDGAAAHPLGLARPKPGSKNRRNAPGIRPPAYRREPSPPPVGRYRTGSRDARI